MNFRIKIDADENPENSSEVWNYVYSNFTLQKDGEVVKQVAGMAAKRTN